MPNITRHYCDAVKSKKHAMSKIITRPNMIINEFTHQSMFDWKLPLPPRFSHRILTRDEYAIDWQITRLKSFASNNRASCNRIRTPDIYLLHLRRVNNARDTTNISSLYRSDDISHGTPDEELFKCTILKRQLRIVM